MNWKPIHLETNLLRHSAKARPGAEHWLICFHGYAQHQHMFDEFVKITNCPWSILCLDLPLFGETKWNAAPSELDQAYLAQLWAAILEKCKPAKVSLLGFSMGGKFAMAMYLQAPIPIENMFLFAPDGILSNPWHALVRTDFGQRCMQYFLNRSQLIIKTADLLFRYRLLSRFSFLFVRANLANEADQILLRNQLKIYKGIDYSLKNLIHQAEKTNTRWHLILGQSDQTFPKRLPHYFKKRIPNSQVHLLKGGHLLFMDIQADLSALFDKIFQES